MAVYDYSKCIKCYCCQEMCPEQAITVKKSLLARIAAGTGVSRGPDFRYAYRRFGRWAPQPTSALMQGRKGAGSGARSCNQARGTHGAADGGFGSHAASGNIRTENSILYTGHGNSFRRQYPWSVFFMRRKRRPPSCAARCVHRTAISGIPSLPAGRNAGGTDTDVLKER
ncbi:MAG: 4Fe-4S binding protein [Clostridia bacterium]